MPTSTGECAVTGPSGGETGQPTRRLAGATCAIRTSSASTRSRARCRPSRIPSAFASARSLPPSRPMSASTCPNRCRGTAGAAIGIDHAGSRFPDVGHAFAHA
jgi:hypothetical protein